MAETGAIAPTQSTNDLRGELVKLIATLPDSELHAALRYLRFLEEEADPLLRRLREAPYDDEEWTEEELREADLAWDEIEAGKGVPLSEIDTVDLDA
jgi:hypothetical protein